MTTTRAAAKKPALPEVLVLLEKLYGTPVWSDRPDDPLIDHLLVGVLGSEVGLENARECVRALSGAFLDMNEVRNSPLSELEHVLSPFVPPEKRRAICWSVRMALQDVWDGCHGLDLEPLRGRDPEDQRAYLHDLPNTPGGPAALLFQLALGEKRLALGPREQHLLTRLGMLPRSNSPERLRLAMERKIKPADRYRFAWILGAASHAYEVEWDPAHPFCKLLVACKAKEVVERERARKREQQRRVQEEKRRKAEEAKRLKAEERERQRLEREETRRRQAQERAAREVARKQAQRQRELARKEAARKKAEAKKKAALKKKADLKKQALALKKQAAAKKKADARKKAEAKKKAVALKKKKAAALKQKAVALKKKAAAKKKAAKKKPAPKKKPASKKKPATRKKPAPTKKAAKKKAAPKKKKTATRKKPAPRKKAQKKAPSRRRPVKK